MVLEIARLRFYSTTYSRKDEHKGGHSIEKRSSGHKGGQQRRSTAER